MAKKIHITLNDLQLEALDKLMAEDLETNRSAYLGRFIAQEVARREESAKKRPVGRPKKEEEEEVFYPAPYKGGAPYSRDALQAYYDFRKQPMPDPMPQPLTKEELKKWDL